MKINKDIKIPVHEAIIAIFGELDICTYVDGDPDDGVITLTLPKKIKTKKGYKQYMIDIGWNNCEIDSITIAKADYAIQETDDYAKRLSGWISKKKS